MAGAADHAGDVGDDSDDQDAAITVGDAVQVELLEGDESRAIVVDDCDAPASEHTISIDGDWLTVYRYWGRTIPEDDAVWTVRFLQELDNGEWQPTPGRYDVPASKIEPAPLEADGRNDGSEGGSNGAA